VRGVEVAALPVRVGVPPRETPALVAGLAGRARQVDGRLYAEEVAASVAAGLRALVDDFHRRNPLEPGIPLQSARSQLGAPASLAEDVLRREVGAGSLEVTGALVRRSGWQPALSPAQERTRAELLAALERAGREPPSVGELEARYGAQTASLLRLLERAESIVQVEADRYYARGAVGDMTAELLRRMAPGREYAPPELREILGFSRKYLIPFLEYCDRVGVTERRPAGRVVKGA
jgi:selenocysteine-specific elongation factor